MNVFELICILKYVFYKCCDCAYECLQVLWPLLQVLRHQKMHDFGVQGWTHGLVHARVHGRVLTFCVTIREHGQDTRPCIMAVFATAQNF